MRGYHEAKFSQITTRFMMDPGVSINYVGLRLVLAKRREAILDDLSQSKRGLISNARCLTEGVNLPSVDCVAFIDPRSSVVDIVQATGRAMRTNPANPKKKYGYVFIPLYVEQKIGC